MPQTLTIRRSGPSVAIVVTVPFGRNEDTSKVYRYFYNVNEARAMAKHLLAIASEISKGAVEAKQGDLLFTTK